MSETPRDKDNDLRKKSFFSHSFVTNPLKSAGGEESDPRRFLHRQKSDFSETELQELQQKLEKWIQESKARRISYDGLSGIEFSDTDVSNEDRTDEEYDDSEF